MSQEIVYISAVETGLVKWNEFRKPPYSEQDYLDAYNNGKRMTQAFNVANANGASKVVLERGNYPFCYAASGRYPTSITLQNNITGTNNLEIDGNGSCIFAIFDSVNRSPYQTGDALTYLQPYQLCGSIFALTHNTNLNIHNFDLRGDQYNRAWVTGEKDTEQTYGILLCENNYNTKIDIKGHGFRGDAISSLSYKTSNVANLTQGWSTGGDWVKGGLSSTGLEIEQAGAYRSSRIDLREQVIYRNAVQIMTHGGISTMQNREDIIGAYFYKADGTFISREDVWQTEFIYLPKDCAFIQLVCYGDERTDDIVGYGTYLFLVTGCSDIAEIKGEYFANHRGAVSNLCNNTIIDADIHDNGTLKYGFPHYSDPTRYGVNFEDTYVSKLTVKGSIRNGGSAILANARQLDVTGCKIKNMIYGAISTFSSKEVNINGCLIDNVRSVWGAHATTASPIKRMAKINDNIIRNSDFYGDFTESTGMMIDISNNLMPDVSVRLYGNGKNLIFNNNTTPSFARVVPASGSYIVREALKAVGNTVIFDEKSPSSGTSPCAISATDSALNRIIEERTMNSQLIGASILNSKLELTGTTFDSLRLLKLNLPYSQSLSDYSPFSVDISACTFNSNLGLGEYTTADYRDSTISFEKCVFNKKLLLLMNENRINGTHSIIFKDCEINLDDTQPYFIDTVYATMGKMNIVFIDCTFIKPTPISDKFKVFGNNPKLANLTARAYGCSFINVASPT